LVELSLVVLIGAITMFLALAALGAPRTMLVGPPGLKPAWSRALIVVALVGSALWALAAVAQLVGVMLQARSRLGVDRGQLLSLGVALLATLAGVVGLAANDAAPFQALVALALPLGLAGAVLRYALYDLDLLVHRLPVWVVLTAAVVAAVVAAVTGASWVVTRLLPAQWNRTGDVLVMAALVLMLDPTRRLVQRGVNHLLFGYRNAPQEALSVLGHGLGSATAQHSTQQLCHSVAATLALPWVGLRRGEVTVAAWGRATSTPLEVALNTEPQPTTLLLCPRRAGERFNRADMRIVQAMAAQVGVAVQALNLADDLQGARERLVRAREEERKRLRDDLHDGVAPALAGLRMQTRAFARSAPGPWQRLEEDLRACSAEIARLVDGLRPPALDTGLPQALRREATRWQGGDVDVRVDVGPIEWVTPLPAAVETAAYRIATEAVSNAVRHASAGIILVSLAVQPSGNGDLLLLRVHDDGIGALLPRQGGVGLTSMRDRAEELGGTLNVCPIPGEGTTVTALFPLGAATSAPTP
jgi:signal transduction histidine kinase